MNRRTAPLTSNYERDTIAFALNTDCYQRSRALRVEGPAHALSPVSNAGA